MSRDNVLRIVNMLRSDLPRNRGSISGRDKRSCSDPKVSYWLWAHQEILLWPQDFILALGPPRDLALTQGFILALGPPSLQSIGYRGFLPRG